MRSENYLEALWQNAPLGVGHPIPQLDSAVRLLRVTIVEALRRTTQHEIYAHPANRFVADFIGRACFLSAQVVDASDGQLTIHLARNVKLEIPATPGVRPRDHVVAVVRPEALDILPEVEGNVKATVAFAHYTGSVATYKLLLPGEETIQVEVRSYGY